MDSRQLNVPEGRIHGFYSVDDILSMPDPEYLIDGVIPCQSLGTIYAPSDHFKSFIVLDMGLHIAAGMPWMGRDVKQGMVVLLAGEGNSGIKKRLKAWMKAHPDADIRGHFVMHDSVALDAVTGVIENLQQEMAIAKIAPTLFIVDTLATNMQGDENSTKDMNWLLSNVKRIRNGQGNPTVLIVHHTGWQAKDRERGSYALPAAVDTRIQVLKNQNNPWLVTLHCKKLKDDSDFEPIRVKLTEMPLDPVKGKPVSSLYVTNPTAEEAEQARQDDGYDLLIPGQRNLLDTLIDMGGTAGATVWQQAAKATDGTFQRHRKVLLNGGWVESTDAGYSITTQTREALFDTVTLKDGSILTMLRKSGPIDLDNYPDPFGSYAPDPEDI